MEPAGVKSLLSGLRVLNALAEHPDPVTATELAGELDQGRVQLSRILRALELAALATTDDSGPAYRLSAELSAQADSVVQARLRREGPAIVRSLAEQTGTAAFVVELRGDSAVTVLEFGSSVSWVGRSYPAYCDDGGQALLLDADRAELDAVFAATEFRPYGPNAPRSVDDFERRTRLTRERGYSICDEEVEAGVLAVAAPVRDFSGRIVCAIHVEGDRAALADRVSELGRSVLEHAATLSGLLGAS